MNDRSARSGLDARIVHRRGDFSLDVTMRIAPGEVVAVVGPNGAGKSTTVAALTGAPLHGDDSGTSIALDGRPWDADDTFVEPEQRRVGTVFQDALLFDHLSVVDNVAFASRSRGASRRASRRSAVEWLERLDLGGLAARRPAELSGGQAQRVAIARALASEPSLLLLDEPLAALDVETRVDVRRLLRDHLGDVSAPTMLVTHDPGDAFLLADRIDVVEDGRITQSGTPEEIRRSPATPYVAALAGTNLLAGTATNGTVVLLDHDHSLTVADRGLLGPVLVTIHPSAISLHPTRPTGSQRNTWATTVERVEPLGDIARVTLAAPLPIVADVTPAAVDALDLAPGISVWAAVKATEVEANAT